MEKLWEIVKELKKIRTEELHLITDDAILENSVKIYNTWYIQNTRSSKGIFERKDIKKELEPATSKQIELIRKLNKNVVPAGISKKDASDFIGKLKGEK